MTYERAWHTYGHKNGRLFRYNRKEKLKEVGRICQLCDKEGCVAHHIDCSNDNHDLGNLLIVCISCHGSLHSNKNPFHTKMIKKRKNFIKKGVK